MTIEAGALKMPWLSAGKSPDVATGPKDLRQLEKFDVFGVGIIYRDPETGEIIKVLNELGEEIYFSK